MNKLNRTKFLTYNCRYWRHMFDYRVEIFVISFDNLISGGVWRKIYMCWLLIFQIITFLPLTIKNFSIWMNTNQTIGYSDITPLAFFGITKERIRNPNTINQGIMECNLRRFRCPIGAGIVQARIVPWLTKNKISIIILENKIDMKDNLHNS